MHCVSFGESLNSYLCTLLYPHSLLFHKFKHKVEISNAECIYRFEHIALEIIISITISSFALIKFERNLI